MKKKFLAILLGALIVMSMLPLSGLAASTVTVVPKEGNGDYFAKFEKKATNGQTTTYYFDFTAEKDVEYKISYDVRIEEGSVASFCFGYCKGSNYESALVTGSFIGASGTTDGWVTKESTFTGGGAAGVVKFGLSKTSGLGAVYVDNMKLYKTSEPDVNLLANGSFEEEFSTYTVTAPLEDGSGKNGPTVVPVPASGYIFYKGANAAVINGSVTRVASDVAVIPDATVYYNYDFSDTYTAITTFQYKATHVVERVEFPENSGNYVLKSSGESTDTVKVIPSFSPSLDNNTIMKLSFRMYIPEQTVADGTVSFRCRVTKDGSIYTGQSISNIPFETWKEYEMYFNCVPTTSALSAYLEYCDYTYYIDDIKLEKFNAEGYVSEVNVTDFIVDKRNGAMSLTAQVEKNPTYTRSSVIKPIIIHDPVSLEQTAYIFSALNKVDASGIKTLIDVKVMSNKPDNLTNCRASWALSMSGILYEDALSFNLAEYENLTAGNYEVEHFVWNGATLAPLGSGSVSFAIAE